MNLVNIVQSFSPAVFAVGDLFDFGLFDRVEVVELKFAMADDAVTERILQFLAAFDFLFWQNIKAKNFHKALLAKVEFRSGHILGTSCSSAIAVTHGTYRFQSV